MRIGMIFGLGLAVGVGLAAEACSSDSSGNKSAPDGGSGAKTGAGGSGSGLGGGSSAGGSTSNGGATVGAGGGIQTTGCDRSSCDQAAARISQMVGGSTQIQTCCVDANTCGFDASALGQGCVPFRGFPDGGFRGFPDGGFRFPGGGVTILDGGIIPVGDGGTPILLDSTCPGVPLLGNFLKLPGCCLPTGKCGSSTHTLGGGVPLACVTNAEVAAALQSSQFGQFLSVPPDPNQSCDYTISGGAGGASGKGGATGTGGETAAGGAPGAGGTTSKTDGGSP
jgi:hypothetical protein